MSKEINSLLIKDNNVAINTSLGNSYKLTETGSEILKYIQDGKSKEEIIELLVEEYKISKHELYIDVSDFYEKLNFYGVL
jgi:DNA-binding CsgD family transcriptional regulator